ncbi:MAG: EI24 domain-containing protein [Acidobacteria bacterium]|nr:EI24 domain-containing protein [Acidobacteriota bacterium]MBI3421364.1 EI24 domain-containing protein [Acidobacteriota bacterium]
MYPNAQPTTPASGALDQLWLGAKHFFAGLNLLFRQRQLLWLSLVPLMLTVVMLVVLAAFFAWVVGGLLVGIATFLAGLAGQPKGVSPELALTLQAWSFLLGLFFASTFYLPLARVLLAPFSETLCRKTHELTHSGTRYQSSLGWARAMWEGLKLVALQLAVLLVGLVISFGLPVIGQLFLMLLTMVLCGMDYLDVPLAARGLPLRAKLGLLWRHKLLACGFAAAGYVLLYIPLVNILSLPVGVIGATLLTDQWPEQQ